MKQGILLALLLCVAKFLLADDFYWVNNSGDWMDYENHWATTSGGSNMHNRIPGNNDNVYFDDNSFQTTGHIISVNTSHIICKTMDWSNVSNNPEFISQTTDSLTIEQSLILSEDMNFSFFGLIQFQSLQDAQNTTFNPVGHILNSRIEINLPNGTLDVLSDLIMPQSQLLLKQGTLDMNHHNLTVKAFNGNKSNEIPPIGASALMNTDSIQSNQTIFFNDNLNVSNLSSYLLIQLQTEDSSYVHFGNNIPDIDIEIKGSKKCFLTGPLQTSGNINLNMSGTFSSQNHDISCNSFISDNPFSRTINLGTSEINTENFIISGSAMNFISSNATLSFSNGTEFIYQSNNLFKTFSNLNIEANSSAIFKSGLNAGNLTIGANCELLINDNQTLNINNLTCNSDCGNFITIRGYCNDMPYLWPDENCLIQKPIINCSNEITADYLKLAFIQGIGNVFTANNSYNQGNVSGWIINEPSSTDTYYWVGNQGNWDDPLHWSLTSGGAPQNCIPGKDNSVIFDSNSFSSEDTLFISQHAYCKNMSWENIPNNVTIDGNSDIYIKGDMTLHENLNSNFNGIIYFFNDDASAEDTIITKNIQLKNSFVFKGKSKYDFADSLFTTSGINLISGGISFSGQYAQLENLISKSDSIRDLIIDNSKLEIFGEGTCWLLNNTNLTFTANASSIVLNSNYGLQRFYGEDLTYDSLKIKTPTCLLKGSNNFKLLELIPGTNLNLEPLSTTTLDSLIAIGDCSAPIHISTGNSNDTAQLSKSGNDVLNISNVHLSNITADISNGATYTADASTYNGSTNGWIFTNESEAKTYHWTGNTKFWNDLNNWETESTPATCLPGIKDTIVIDEAHLLSAITDTILISNNQYCAVLDASDCNSLPVNFILEANLEISHNLMLSNEINFEYQELLSPNNLFTKNHGLIIAPDGNNAEILSNNAIINVNLYCKAYQTTDSISINDNLSQSNLAGIIFYNGNLISNGNTINTDLIKCEGDNLKTLNLKNSQINIGFFAEFQNSTKLNIIADSSHITLVENMYNSAIFNGGNQTFFDITFNMSENQGETDDYSIFIIGSNNFHLFTVNPGGTLQFQGGSTQTIDSTMSIKGTCIDKIELLSDHPGTSFHIEKTNSYQDTCYSLIVSDMDINNPTIAKLSTDLGNNSGIDFDETQAAIALFEIPYPACVANDLTFNNTSSSMWGGITNLEFEWIIQDIDTSSENDLSYNFQNQGEYIIHLKATDTITRCYSNFSDTLTLIKQSAFVSASPSNLTICEGETIEFSGTSNQTVDYEFYLNNTALNLGTSSYSSNTLSDGDQIYVETILNGCSEYSDTLTTHVNPLPLVSLTSDPANAEICEGESITFTANGADLYQFYIDGNPITSMTTENTFTTSVISDLSVVSVEAKFTESGCTAWNETDITVHSYTNPTVSLSSDIEPAIICEGHELNFTAAGADNYEFFINGTSQAEASATNVFSSDNLNNSDIITVIGSNTHGCSTLSSFINVTVNPAPSLSLTSSDDNNDICNGEEVIFSAEGAAEYLFFLDNAPLGDFSTTQTYNHTSLTNGQTINIAGRIGNCYDTLSNPLTITVHPSITLNASTQEICTGEEISFTANGDDNYEFFIDGISQGTSGTNNMFIRNDLQNGDIITVEGSTGACLPDGIEITVHDLPTPVLTCNDSDLSICAGEEISFTAEGAYQYQFFINGTSVSPASVLNSLNTTLNNEDIVTLKGYSQFGCFADANETISIEVRQLPIVSLNTTDPTSLCAGDHVSINATGADTYEFYQNGNSLGESSTISNITLDNIQNGDIITVEGFANNCSDLSAESLEYTVFGIPLVSLEATSETSVCEGEEITVQANGATEYEFFINGISQGEASNQNTLSSANFSDEDAISVIGYQNICSDTANNLIIVDINEIPIVELTTNIPATGLCFGDTIECHASGAEEYQFFLDGVSLGETSETNSIAINHYFDEQEITVFGHNNSCIRETEYIANIVLNRVQTTISTNTAGSTICEGNQITAMASGATEYEFFLDGVSLGSASTNNSTSFELDSNGHTLWVAGTDTETGCTEQSAEINLNIQENPEITAYPSTIFCENDSILLQTNQIGNNMIWFHNGEMICSNNNNELYIHEAGEYSLQLINGQSDQVFSTGNNAHGQLGTGNIVDSETMVKSQLNEAIKSIKAGDSHTIAINNNGEIYCWGSNAYGNIGDGTYSDAYSPKQISTNQEVISIAAGSNHNLALLKDSTLLSWGKNDFGQLGYGNYAASNFPNHVININKIIAIDAGTNHSIALDSDGNVYAWGNNEYGQLGIGNFETQNEATQITSLSNIISIATGGNHNLALDANGHLWVWGSNANGQLGLGDVNNRNIPIKIENFHEIILIAAGQNHTLAYNSLGECYSWGSNTSGQLGISGISQSTSPEKIDISNITKLEAGESNSFAIRSDKSLWAWGQNNTAQLTLGHNNTVEIPEQSSIVFGISDIAAGNEFTSVIWEDALQCESETIDINMIDVPEVEIAQTDNILRVNQGIAWQWFLNGSEIPNANSSEYIVSSEGDYSVLVEFETGCSVLTQAITIGSDIAKLINENDIFISPNPANNYIHIHLNMDNNKISEIKGWEIMSTNAEVLIKSDKTMEAITKINISELSPAVYYLRITSTQQIIIKKLIKQ